MLARDGAEVIALDVPAAGDALAGVANDVRGRALQLDLTAPDAGERLAGYLAGGVDIVVHNAGITRDKTIAKMDAEPVGLRARGQPVEPGADQRGAAGTRT